MSLDLDTKTIYEIFRACRLCGAGGGYKMPIIPSVVGFDCPDIELRQKIRECVQIEVNQDDKMPPLICEYCVDKVNDFYGFLEMCRETNRKTRVRLGLPQQSMSQGVDSDDCILGVTEQITFHSSSPSIVEESTPRPRLIKVKTEGRQKPSDKKKENDKRVKGLRRELEDLIKVEKESTNLPTSRHSRLQGVTASRNHRSTRDISLSSTDSRPSSCTRSSPTRDDQVSLSRIRTKEQQRKKDSHLTKSNLRKRKETNSMLLDDHRDDDDSSDDFNSLLAPLKGNRERNVKEGTPPKRFKPSPKPSIASVQPSKTISPIGGPAVKLPPAMKPGPKTKKIKLATRLLPPVEESPLPTCNICLQSFKTGQGLGSHLRQHTATFTTIDQACNSCCEWFGSAKSASDHHKEHKTNGLLYRCRGCYTDYRKHENLVEHVESSRCYPYKEVPDKVCPVCRKQFPTDVLYKQHEKTCEPMAKCTGCNRTYQKMMYLKKHQANCKGFKTDTKPSAVKIQPQVRRRLMPAQVRMIRCDRILKKNTQRRYNVSGVAPDFDLDKKSVYPYRQVVKVKQEPLFADKMVSIDRDVQFEFYREEDYVHWDSDLSSDSDSEFSLINPTKKIIKVPSLTTLSLKTIFSRRCLGKVPRKLRKVKDKFDLFNDFEQSEFNITNLIDNLDDEVKDAKKDEDSDTLLSLSLLDVKNDNEVDSVEAKATDVDNDDAKSKENDTDADLLFDTKRVNETFDFDAVKASDVFNEVKVGDSDHPDNGNDTDASVDDIDDKNVSNNEIAPEIDEEQKEIPNVETETSHNGDVSPVNHKTNGDNIDEANVNEELNEIVNNVIMEINEIGNSVNDISTTVNGSSLQNNDFDSRQVLADLDAAIGEGETGDENGSGKDKDAISIEDLLPKDNSVLDDINSEDDFGDV